MSKNVITADEARKLAMEGAVLLDVRTREEYASGRIPNSVNLPLDELEQIDKKIPRDKVLVVYCQSGIRSAAAARLLKNMGRVVHDLGSIRNWTFGLEK